MLVFLGVMAEASSHLIVIIVLGVASRVEGASSTSGVALGVSVFEASLPASAHLRVSSTSSTFSAFGRAVVRRSILTISSPVAEPSGHSRSVPSIESMALTASTVVPSSRSSKVRVRA